MNVCDQFRAENGHLFHIQTQIIIQSDPGMIVRVHTIFVGEQGKLCKVCQLFFISVPRTEAKKIEGNLDYRIYIMGISTKFTPFPTPSGAM